MLRLLPVRLPFHLPDPGHLCCISALKFQRGLPVLSLVHAAICRREIEASELFLFLPFIPSIFGTRPTTKYDLSSDIARQSQGTTSLAKGFRLAARLRRNQIRQTRSQYINRLHVCLVDCFVPENPTRTNERRPSKP